MPDQDLVKAVQAALDAYKRKMDADPDGARERLMKTGIWTKSGRLSANYSDRPKKTRAAG